MRLLTVLVYSQYFGSELIYFHCDGDQIIIPPLREGAILQSPCLSVRSHFSNISQLLMEEMILYLIYGFGMVTCTVSALSRFTAHLLHVYRAT